jgi:hypothetical protein
MRENRPSGSEGGGTGTNRSSLPLSASGAVPHLAAELLHLPDKPAGVGSPARHAMNVEKSVRSFALLTSEGSPCYPVGDVIAFSLSRMPPWPLTRAR